MADAKITALTGLSTVADEDKLYIVDVSDTTDGVDGTSKHITKSNLFSGYALTSDLSSYATLTGSETLTNKTLTAPKFADGGFIADANGNELLEFDSINSAVNHVRVINSATGFSPGLEAVGSDTNIDFIISSKNTGSVELYTDEFTTLVMSAKSTGDVDLNSATANIQVNGADPKRGLYIDAAAMKARTTSGAASSSTETTTNKVMKTGFAFDKDADEFVQFKIPAPKYWDLGTITVTPYWTADAGTTGTVAFAVQAQAVSNDDALDTAFGTAQTSTDTFIATGDLHIGPATSAITVGGTPAKSDMLIFQIYRDVSEDTFDADAILLGLHISFGISQYDDQ